MAQLVAHLVWDQGVPRSSRGIPTYYTGRCPETRRSRSCRICLRQIHDLRRTADAVFLYRALFYFHFGRTVVFIFARDKLSQDALRKVPRKDAVCEWKMSVGRLQPGLTLRQRSRGARSRHFDACGPKQQGFSPPSRLSRSQQVICAANDADGENGRCPVASQPRALNAGLTFSSQDGHPYFLAKDSHQKPLRNANRPRSTHCLQGSERGSPLRKPKHPRLIAGGAQPKGWEG